jgi:hypothetical protein
MMMMTAWTAARVPYKRMLEKPSGGGVKQGSKK